MNNNNTIEKQLLTQKPLHIAVFYDNRPGHIKQTRGIVDALAGMTAVETRVLTVKHLSLGREIASYLQYFVTRRGKTNYTCTDCDLLIGTGSRTHIPLLQGKRIYGVPAVTSMTPAWFLRKRFDLCFSPRHDGVQPADNIVFTHGPPNCCTDKGRHLPHHGLIVVGGLDPKSHKWSSAEIIENITTLVEKEKSMTWTISSSPRTPPATVTGLEALGRKYAHASFISFTHTPPGWIEDQYDRNQTVWITADSMSMIYEALTAGCHVGLIPVQWNKKDSKFCQSEIQLLSRGIVQSFMEWQQGKPHTFPSQTFNESTHCAYEILKKWWPNRLQ